MQYAAPVYNPAHTAVRATDMKRTRASGEPTKHQVKSEATLRALLDAAETIFVRDGYERAQIETIAAAAGRTKGAIYAHFQSKEDVFFALLERKAKSRREAFGPASREARSKPPIEIIKKIFVNALEDENWHILMLEFKVFALRNKDSLRRVRDLYQLLYDEINRGLLPEGEGFTRAQKNKVLVALAVLRGIPSAVLLEKQFNPALTSQRVGKKALEAVFDSLLTRQDLKPRGKNKKT
jgi:AcrR family transcriptional regulator